MTFGSGGPHSRSLIVLVTGRRRGAAHVPAAGIERREGDMHWRRSTWVFIAWTSVMGALVLYSIPNTAAGYEGWVVAYELGVWFAVSVPIVAYWYTRRKSGTTETRHLDPRDHWPPPPR
jgi:hypothetical protein